MREGCQAAEFNDEGCEMTEPGKAYSHGKTWTETCPECDLVSAREFVRRWAPLVDEARAKIAEAEQTTEEQR